VSRARHAACVTRTDLQLAADRLASRQRRDLTDALRQLIADSGVSQRLLADVSGVSQGYISDLLAGTERPTIEAYHRLAAALGADLALRLYPNTGPDLRDRWQARMLEEVIRVHHPRWEPHLEVNVMRPARGSIDLLLHEGRARLAVATELQSELRRLEQLIRWQAAKAESLPTWPGWARLGDEPAISRLMIVRRTRATRAAATEFAGQLRVAYPAHPDDAVAALTGSGLWPGPALAWMVVDARGARLVPGR